MNSIGDDRLREIRRRWEQSPGSRVFLQLADGLRRQENYTEAIQVLNRGLELNPGDFSARISLGRCHLESGDAASASDVLEGVVQDDPTQMVATKLLVRAWCDRGIGDQAAFRLDQYRILNPSDPEIDPLQERIDDLLAIEEEPTEQLHLQDEVRGGESGEGESGEEVDSVPEGTPAERGDDHSVVLDEDETEDEEEDEEEEAVTIARPVPGGEVLGAAFDLTPKRSHPPLALGTILTTLAEPFPSLHPTVAPWTGSVFSWPEVVEAPIKSSRDKDSEIQVERLLSTVLEPKQDEIRPAPDTLEEALEEVALSTDEELMAGLEDSAEEEVEASDTSGESYLAGLAAAASLAAAPTVLQSLSPEETSEATVSAEETEIAEVAEVTETAELAEVTESTEEDVEEEFEALEGMISEPEFASSESAEPAELVDLLAEEVIGQGDPEEPVSFGASDETFAEAHSAEEDEIPVDEGEASPIVDPLPEEEVAGVMEAIEDVPVAQPFSLLDTLEDQATEEKDFVEFGEPDAEPLEAVVPVDDAPSTAAEVEVADIEAMGILSEPIDTEIEEPLDEPVDEVIDEDSIDIEDFEPQHTMPVATATLGSLYLNQGHEAKAKEIFEDVLAREPENEAAREGLFALRDEEAAKAEPAVEADEAEEMGLTERKIYVLKNFLSALQREGRHVS